MVPARHVADELRDVAAILRSGFSLVETSQIVNRPIVPRGSQARERLNGAAPEPEAGWYRGQRIQWLRFDEAQLIAGPGAPVPTSPISVMFRGWPAPAARLAPPGRRSPRQTRAPGWACVWQRVTCDRAAMSRE
jgi:hypothetical protein